MKKQIMSIAAAAALISSGAMAFETNSTVGTNVNLTALGATPLLNINGERGAYNTPTALAVPRYLNVSQDHIGDALIFPAYNATDGWSTEIVVRNNQAYGVVAKFVVYSAVDSQELRDFNIYLSANDAFRCTLRDGKITSSDDSVNITQGWGVFENVTIPENTGYVAVYAMAAVPTATDHGPEAKKLVRRTYFHGLDRFREGWNTNATMRSGVFVVNTDDINITSPKIANATVPTDANLTDPNQGTLSGTVRLSNANEPRDLLLNAKAVDNYTDGFIMLWTPRELAAWSDRNIISIAATPTGPYDGYSMAGVLADAKNIAIRKAYYTYNNEVMPTSDSLDLQNKLIVTQPTKRTLIQQGQGGDFWIDGICPAQKEDPVENGTTWGLTYIANVWDEEENMNTIESAPELSPGNDISASHICAEVGETKNLEANTPLAEKNGYAVVDFGNNGVPAIVTQMSASQIGASRAINWLNTPVNYVQQTP